MREQRAKAAESRPEKPPAEVCRRGHPLSGDNLRVLTRSNRKVERICRECVRMRNRASKRRKAERDGKWPR